MNEKTNRPEEKDPRIEYKDIIDMPYVKSAVRPHMSLYDRAAQFAPFAALYGYDEMVDETARIVDDKIVLEGSELEILNEKLSLLSDAISNGQTPEAAITYFVPDPLKEGGSYHTLTECVKRIDGVHRKLILTKKTGLSGAYMEIPFDDLLEITLNAGGRSGI